MAYTVSEAPFFSLIAAVARNGIIGGDGKLLWSLKADLQYFKNMTLSKPIILGRKTYESIGRPLPGRTMIVLSRQYIHTLPPSVLWARNVEESITLARREADRWQTREIMIGGGGEIYTHFLPHARHIYLTEVDLAPPGDTFFPPIVKEEWQEISREEYNDPGSKGVKFSFIHLQRIEEGLSLFSRD